MESKGEEEEAEAEHPLRWAWCLWYRSGLGGATRDYERSLELVGRVATVEQWWGLYAHVRRADRLPHDASFHLFREGVRPMWEDPANVQGGKWEVRVRRANAAPAWEELCMAAIGERFPPDLCGCVMNVRAHEVALAAWHRDAADAAQTQRVHDAMRQVLHLPPWASLDYKRHSKSLRHVAAAATNDTHNHTTDT